MRNKENDEAGDQIEPIEGSLFWAIPLDSPPPVPTKVEPVSTEEVLLLPYDHAYDVQHHPRLRRFDEAA